MTESPDMSTVRKMSENTALAESTWLILLRVLPLESWLDTRLGGMVESGDLSAVVTVNA